MDLITRCSPFGGAANLMGFAHCRRPRCCWFFDVCLLVTFSLLKLLLARWFLDVSFQVTSFRHNCSFVDGFCFSGAQNLSFGRPGASILTPRAIVGNHGSSKKDTLESGIGFLSMTISGAHFDSFLVTEG